jgi:Asp/Glu/hydantoin racemase
MAYKVMILNPWGVDYCDDVALDLVGSAVRDDVELACVNLGEAAPPVPYPVPEGKAAAIGAALKAEADGFDAVLIACGGDPFLRDIRRAVSIPVIGLAESAILSAHSRGKLGILRRRLPSDPWDTVWRDEEVLRNWHKRMARYGIRKDQYSIRCVRVPDHPDLETLERLNRDDPHALKDMMFAAFEASLHADGVDQANAAAADDGVRAVLFPCNFYGPSIAALGEDAAKFAVPVINPMVCAATYAQHLLDSAT